MFCGSLDPSFCLEEGHGDCLFLVIRAFYRFLSICQFYSDIALLPKHPQIFLVGSQYVFILLEYMKCVYIQSSQSVI